MAREACNDIFIAALKAVDPYHCVQTRLPEILAAFEEGGLTKLLVIGFGKAASAMARAVSDGVPQELLAGVILTKYGHMGRGGALPGIRTFEAGHPLPDENGVAATTQILEAVSKAGADTLILCLISGGGSALLAAPAEGITLSEKQAVTELLLRAGATIGELNAVRKHLSRVKGGRLASLARPARIISLILSDVIGDPLDVIASGPTSPDETTYRDAIEILRRLNVAARAPGSVMNFLERGARGEIPETPKEGDPVFQSLRNIIVGSNRMAVEAAMRKAEVLGFQAAIISSALEGEARVVARDLTERTLSDKRSVKLHGKRGLCLISGGETVVTVTGRGLGGRNTELALSFAMEIEGQEGITMLSAGTDGTDGPTDAAGAIVDGETVRRARSLGLDPAGFLNANDSYTFFKRVGGLYVTGPTGTNVMDLQIIIVEGT